MPSRGIAAIILLRFLLSHLRLPRPPSAPFSLRPCCTIPAGAAPPARGHRRPQGLQGGPVRGQALRAQRQRQRRRSCRGRHRSRSRGAGQRHLRHVGRGSLGQERRSCCSCCSGVVIVILGVSIVISERQGEGEGQRSQATATGRRHRCVGCDFETAITFDTKPPSPPPAASTRGIRHTAVILPRRTASRNRKLLSDGLARCVPH